MITRPDVERIAAAINQLRPDWPLRQIATIIERRHTNRAVMDLALALTYVALDRTPDGRLATRTPARVDEQGPWWDGAITDPAVQEYQARQKRELGQRRAEHRIRLEAIGQCDLCDAVGYLPNGRVCIHDPDTQERARAGRQLVAESLHQRSEPA